MNIHHFDGFNWCVEKHTNVDNGVTLCKRCHLNFQSIYGSGNNTRGQFEEYLRCKIIAS